MRVLCWVGMHRWVTDNEMWAARYCGRCAHRQILVYSSADGAVWERIT